MPTTTDGQLLNVADQFRGLPIEHLVGAPLKAASDAQLMLAQSLVQFIEQVGFQPHPPESLEPRVARQIGFSMTRPGQTKEGDIFQERVDLSVPFLTIVPIPNLAVDNVSVDFEMNVHSSISTTAGDSKSGSFDAGVSGGLLFF